MSASNSNSPAPQEPIVLNDSDDDDEFQPKIQIRMDMDCNSPAPEEPLDGDDNEEARPKTQGRMDSNSPAPEGSFLLNDGGDDDESQPKMQVNMDSNSPAPEEPVVLNDGDDDDESTSKDRMDSSSTAPEEPIVLNDGDDDEESQPKVQVRMDRNSPAREEPITLSDDEDDSQPKIQVRMEGIFENDDEDEENDNETNFGPDDIQNMLQMNMEVGSGSQENSNSTKSPKTPAQTTIRRPSEEESPVRRPRRAAAAVAASTIKEISTVEIEDDEPVVSRTRSRKDAVKTYPPPRNNDNDASGAIERNKCTVCKKWAACQIKIQRFGTNLHICSNICFNKMRNIGSGNGRLACGACGINNVEWDKSVVYYWETMNFCSDLCVGNFQVSIGGICATCSKRVPWLSLGKYCVRFGSDIRQFCTAGCLESYKKNARVCFHCQLDIKRLGNVILANIPSKSTPKEFCSQDCVEMYVEQNLQQNIQSKQRKSQTCIICGEFKPCFREIILPTPIRKDRAGLAAGGSLKVCSQLCWLKLLEAKGVTKATKCETCPKYINLILDIEQPIQFVSTEDKVYGFCSPTCKNVFVLKKRQIFSCTTCKVKKYNYDLIQYFSSRSFTYAVCSLNCLPKSSDYVMELRKVLLSRVETRTSVEENGSFPVINSITSLTRTTQPSFSYRADPYSTTMSTQSNLSNGSLSSTFSVPDGNEFASLSYYPSAEPPEQTTEACEEELENVTEEDMELILKLLKKPIQMKTKSLMAKPKQRDQDCQTDTSELDEMNRIPLKTLDKIRYVPMPIPYPVYLPTPAFFWESPVPYPIGLPIPIPIPIPVILDQYYNNGQQINGKLHKTPSLEDVEMSDSRDSILKDSNFSDNAVTSPATAHEKSGSDISFSPETNID